MSKAWKRITVCVVALFSGSCASLDHPPLISNDVLPLDALTAAINCELQNAIEDEIATNTWPKDWQGQYSITLKANHIGYARLGASTFPIVLPRSNLLNFGVAGGFTGNANRTALFKFNINFKDLIGKPRCRPQLRPTGHPFLVGEIGFKEWMARAIAASGDQKSKSNPDKISSIGHTFEFIVDVNASASPSFVLAPAPNILINPTASLERVEDNIVDVSFGKIPPAAVDVSTIAKLLSKEQKDKLKTAENKREQASRTISRATPVLTLSSNIELLKADSELQELKSKLDYENREPNLLSEEQTQKRAALQRRVKGLESITTVNRTQISNLKSLQEQDAYAKLQLTEAQATENLIRSNPSVTKVTHSQAPVPAVALSPEANPNVTNTLLQLQLERLIGTGFVGR